MLATVSPPVDLYSISGGVLRMTLHPGQSRAWDSKRRFVFVIAGTQGGKTSYGPWWVDREITTCGPGDYLAVAPTYDLFKLKMLPELLAVWRLVRPDWTYQKSERVLQSADGKTRLILRSADASGGLESATAKAAWLDECGQDTFDLAAWEAVQRRLSIHQGRVLGTTTPYNLGWLKSQVYDRWAAGDRDYSVIQFRSVDNPRFPRDEYERARRTLPDWKFRMFYNAEFTRPAGMIYDCFADDNIIPPFATPEGWLVYGGLDFGGVNTCALRVICPPDRSRYYVTAEYLAGERTAKEHTAQLSPWGAGVFVGGSWSEGQWRLEFSAAGLPIRKPNISDVETGIQRVYSAMKERRLLISSECRGLIDELGRYSRPVDESGIPQAGIKDKQTFHRLDALRYVMSELNSGGGWLVS